MNKYNIFQLISYLDQYPIKRDIKEFHPHHTEVPSYEHFTGHNHISLNKGMQRYHKYVNKWSDIGQHLTLFPDGIFVTGRDFERTPASMGPKYNPGAFMVEWLGNFDIGVDEITGIQYNTMVHLARYFKDTYNTKIRFHREANKNKTCPGTAIKKATFETAIENWMQ